MSGPRKKSLVAGVYAAGSLGSLQGRKSSGFPRGTHCKPANHSWLFGADCAVCSQCGKTVDKTTVERN